LTTFKELGLSDKILKALTDLGFETPSKIQAQAIPQLLESDSDFIGVAQTGTGKTAAFGLPLLAQIDPSSPKTQALVLAPTRELGQQIAEQLHKYSKYLKKINVLAVYGGAAITNQIRALRRDPQHIIIATPGRLIDLIKRKAVKLDELKYLVLDEADEMLNMGFKDELDEILSFTPEEKQTWLFSATMPGIIKKMVKKYMDNPFEIKIDAKDKVNTNIEHQFVMVRNRDKMEALTRFLDMHPDMRGVVFCRTKRDTQFLAEDLLKKDYKADALHGDLSQHQRDRVMKRFKTHDLQILVATDVAARGIDVNDISHVFHFSLPDDHAYYTHRSGRTARAGKEGTSIAFIDAREGYRINRLERELGISFTKVRIPDTADIANIRIRYWCFKILDQKPKETLPKDIIEQVQLVFGNLSKEELIAKILAHEFENLNLGFSRDLNDTPQSRRPERKSYPRDRGGKKFFKKRGPSSGSGRRPKRKKKNY